MIASAKFVGLDRAVAELSAIGKSQVPFATMQTLNSLAFQARGAWTAEAKSVFDRPTRMTENAVLYRKATMAKLEARVYVRDDAFKGTPPSKYLTPQVDGGGRRVKPIERQLRSRDVLGASQYVVPGKGASLDAHGNVRARDVVKVLAQLGASTDKYANQSPASAARRRRRRARGGEFFAVLKPRGPMQPGVYERIDTAFGSAVRSVLFFVDGVRYDKKFNVYDIGTRIFDERYVAEFAAQLERAQASAR